MRVSYEILMKTYTYNLEDSQENQKLNCLLTSLKGDYFMQGLNGNSTKFQGSYYCESKGFNYYKILDEIILKDYSTKEVKFSLDSFSRSLSKEGIEFVAKDSFFMTPTGEIIYTLENSTQEAYIDLDIHLFEDFDEWGREYIIEQINDIYLIKFVKKKNEENQYTLFVGIKVENGSINLLKEWIKKEYFYSKERGSQFERYVYRMGSFKSEGIGKLFISSGKNKDNLIENLNSLSKNEEEIRGYYSGLKKEFLINHNFKKPLSYENLQTYLLNVNALYSFVCNSIEKENLKEGLVAGYPWFSQVWNRDELVSLKSYMILGEDEFVKKRLDYYFLMIDSESGLLKRLQSEESYESCDGIFWLAKRFEEFIIHVDKVGRLEEFYGPKDLKRIYSTFRAVFEKIIYNFWDSETELLKVKQGDSWMDTISVEYPMDIQVQFLSFLSALSSLASVCGSAEDAQKFIDFEELFKSKIKISYFRKGLLYDELNYDRLTVNTFLAYYLFSDLFEKSQWEKIFDKTLNLLKTSWGGLSSLSRKDQNFCDTYSGENNKSYHNGDSWYFMNHIAAITMARLNEKRYRKEIQLIIKSSSKDILKMGTLGFCSEISSAKEQRAEGNFAQLWSSATFVELINELNQKDI